MTHTSNPLRPHLFLKVFSMAKWLKQRRLETYAGESARFAHAYASTGKRAAAEKILRDLEQKAKTGQASPYAIATTYAGIGENDKAFEFLEQAYRQKGLDLSWALRADFRTDPLRSDPRFEELVRRFKFTP